MLNRITEVTIETPENNPVTNTDERAFDTVCHRPNLSFGKREWEAMLEVQTSEETSIPNIMQTFSVTFYREDRNYICKNVPKYLIHWNEVQC